MSKDRKLLLLTIILAAVSIVLVVFRYEKLLKQEKGEFSKLQKVVGGVAVNKQYTANEIIELIKKDPQYLGDSITIFENGEMLSTNAKLQGTINAVINSKDNMAMVTGEMNSNKLPLQYNVYRLASAYYQQMYKSDTAQ